MSFIQKPNAPKTSFVSQQSDIQRIQSGNYQSDIQQVNQYNEQDTVVDSPQEIQQAQQQARGNGGFSLPPIQQSPGQVMGFDRSRFDENNDACLEKHHHHSQKTKEFLGHQHGNTHFSTSPYNQESQTVMNKMVPFRGMGFNPINNMVMVSGSKNHVSNMISSSGSKNHIGSMLSHGGNKNHVSNMLNGNGNLKIQNFMGGNKSNINIMNSISKKFTSKKRGKGFSWEI